MANPVNLYLWTGSDWVEALCNDAGKLIIDPSEILEDTPTDGEVAKAPTSNWAYDHEHDTSEHLSILTTKGDIIQRGASAPARLAIGNPKEVPTVHSTAGTLYYDKYYRFMQLGEIGLHFFHWTTTLTGSASEISKDYGILQLATGATAGATARSRGFNFGWLNWSTFRIIWRVDTYYNAPSANSVRWIKVDADVSGDPTAESIGFRIDGTALKGIVHNGTSLTVVDLNTTYSSANSSLAIVYDGTTVFWYVAGVLKGQSTNVPSAVRAVNHFLLSNVINGADNTDNRFRFAYHWWSKDYSIW